MEAQTIEGNAMDILQQVVVAQVLHKKLKQ